MSKKKSRAKELADRIKAHSGGFTEIGIIPISDEMLNRLVLGSLSHPMAKRQDAIVMMQPIANKANAWDRFDHLPGIRLDPSEWDQTRKGRLHKFERTPYESGMDWIRWAIKEAEEDGIGRPDEVRVIVVIDGAPPGYVTVYLGFCAKAQIH